MMLKYFYLYLLFINVIAVIVCFTDKIKAKNGSYRIPERTLFVISILGGSFGMYVAMKTIRHKTKHNRFMIGIPLIMILQVLLLLIFRFTEYAL